MKKFNRKLTDAERVFKDSPILTSRPEGMSHEEYKAIRTLQTRAIRFVCAGSPNQKIANLMRPKQKSEHHHQMVHNARVIKYGVDITKEAKDNKKVLEDKPSWLIKQINKIRAKFN